MELVKDEKLARFWEHKINSHSGIREYNFDHTRKAEKQKELSRKRTLERRLLRELEKAN